MSILRDNLLVEGVGFPSDVSYTSDEDILFLTHESARICKGSLMSILWDIDLFSSFGFRALMPILQDNRASDSPVTSLTSDGDVLFLTHGSEVSKGSLMSIL